jgi:hypothetical protein
MKIPNGWANSGWYGLDGGVSSSSPHAPSLASVRPIATFLLQPLGPNDPSDTSYLTSPTTRKRKWLTFGLLVTLYSRTEKRCKPATNPNRARDTHCASEN